MTRVQLGRLYLQASAAIEGANAQQVLKDFLLWLAVTSTGDHVHSKGAILAELIRLCAKKGV